MEQSISIKDAVVRRKSSRSFNMSGLTKDELSQITEYAKNIPSLLPGIKTKAEIIGPDDVKSITKWRAPHYLAIYSEDSNTGLMNAGFVYEQVALYLTSLGIGTCWATSISPKDKHENDGMKWAAVIAFGRTQEEVWRDAGTAKRKAAEDIYDRKDDALEAARLAPSSMNNQPWRFEHNGDDILVFCKKQGFMKKWMVSQNRIDIGIALGNISAVSKSFRFTLPEKETEKNGYTLMGKICLD